MLIGAFLGLVGCHGADGPFADPLADLESVSTASVDAAHALARQQEIRRREFETDVAVIVEPAVSHGPLYWEDPFEDPTAECQKCSLAFAWGLEDYASVFYSPGRFLANSVLLPVSVLIYPPWVEMESDGAAAAGFLGERHDARRVQ
jgi:hypothetical protein